MNTTASLSLSSSTRVSTRLPNLREGTLRVPGILPPTKSSSRTSTILKVFGTVLDPDFLAVCDRIHSRSDAAWRRKGVVVAISENRSRRSECFTLR